MNADPIYERRELMRSIKLPAKNVQRNIQSSLIAYLKTHVTGRCGVEGFISADGITILQHSIGQVVDGGVLYQVKFQADICYPHKQQIFKAPAVLTSRIGVTLETGPMRILIPRDLHIGNAAFEAIKTGDEVTFQVVGSEFKQDDSTIFVLGQVLKTDAAQAEKKTEEVEVAQPEVPVASSGDIKQVTASPAVIAEAAPKKRKKILPGVAAPIERSGTLEINPSAE